MNTKTLGKTDIICPPIIYGTSFLGNLYHQLSESDKLALMTEWFKVSESPVIDCAGKYGAGLALEVIGQGLKKLGIPPKKITISNKLGWYRVPLETPDPTFEPGVWANLKYDAVQKISYDGILECWEQGCQLLGNGYKPELVSVHDPDEYLFAAENENDRENRIKNILDAYRALFELKEKGLVKGVGVGAKDWLIIKELFNKVPFDWVMIANKFTIYHHPTSILNFFDRLKQDNVGIINSAIFNAGFLTGGKYFDYRIVDEKNPDDKPLFEWRSKFFEVCKQYSIKPGDACLKFSISAPQIDAIALNPSKPERIARNKELINMEIPSDFWKTLKKVGIIDPDYPYL